jgi:flagellar basal-body rod protein FlgC
VYRKWPDAISDNIANVNTVRPTNAAAFQARYVIAQSVTSPDGTGGVQVGGIALGNAQGRLVHDPQHPLADADGYVRMPDIDLGSQMTQMIMAQRGYQANLAVVDRAKDAYQAAIQLGRN